VLKTVFTSEGTARVRPRQRGRRATVMVALVAVVVLATASCATSPGRRADDGAVHVVAAENFWGSLAQQLGGPRARVTSIIDNPNADPHDYEPTAADARALATADLAVVNGIGYDEWASKLLAANPVEGRRTLNVGDVVGIEAGGNPHRWYSPTDVRQVVGAITAAYKQLDPAHADYYDREHDSVLSKNLRLYFSYFDAIKAKYTGTPIGASESLVVPLADALGLRLLTPASFLEAVSEGAEPTAADKSLIDRQIETGQITVFIYNSQNATPDVQAQVDAARAHGIPVVSVTETMTPANNAFQHWQGGQLQRLRYALMQVTSG